MARVIVAAVAVIIIFSLGAFAIDTGGDEVGHQYDIDDETAEAAAAGFVSGERVNLTNSHIEDAQYDPGSTVTVTNTADVEMVEGGDYVWEQSNGTILISNDSALVDESNATVDYSFNVPTDQQRAVLDIAAAQVGLGEVLAVLFGVVFAVAVIRLVGGAA